MEEYIWKKSYSVNIKKFKDEFDMRNPTLSMKVMSYIKTWLIEHIRVTDKDYTDFFNKKGLW